MAQKDETETKEAEPEYITYLLDPNLAHDTYFLVGNNKTKIGAVKKMLVAHSVVLRSELQDSELAEKGDIELVDISPGTFKNLLRHVYGYNNISKLTFDEADDLLYAADKYLMNSLKDQLAKHLMTLLKPENICSLLNNPACHSVLELDAKITEILQYKTDIVFASPTFVNIRIEGFKKIIEQDELAVAEIEIWRAALKWAKHQAKSDNGSDLRKHFSQLKHIRIRAIEFEDICKDVIPSKVLHDNEVVNICIAHGRGETLPAIEGFSDETQRRFPLKFEMLQITSNSIKQQKKTSIRIDVINDIVLLPFEFQANSVQSSTEYQCEGTIEVAHIKNPQGSSLLPNKIIKFSKKVKCGQLFNVSLDETLNTRFLSNNSYTITIEFNEPHNTYYINQYKTSANTYSDGNLVCISNSYQPYSNGYYYYYFPFTSLKYVKRPSR